MVAKVNDLVMLKPEEVAVIKAEIDRLEKALKDCSDSGLRDGLRLRSRNRNRNWPHLPKSEGKGLQFSFYGVWGWEQWRPLVGLLKRTLRME